MKKELAEYILKLNEAARFTKQAEDRQVYEMYLAHAGIMLAMLETGSGQEELQNEIQVHERMWANTWLVDEVYKAPAEAWQKVKGIL